MWSSNSLILLLASFSLFIRLVATEKEFVAETSEEVNHYYTFPPSSLLPSSVCNPSTKGDKKNGSLEVVHKHGPCSKFSKVMLTVEETLIQDQSRVDSLRLRARLTTNTRKQDTQNSKTTLPARSGKIIGSANYIVTVGLGTPKKELTFTFDTGSDLTWTQCQPCVVYCYSQQEPIFVPSMSTTYTNTSCTSTACASLDSATGNNPRCISSACVYVIEYGDGSFSVGLFGKDKLTITSQEVVNDFYFGCGQNNQGLFNGAAGILGLGQNKLSIVSQTSKKYKKVFSYCLPSQSSSIGYLTFGEDGAASNVKYTPFSAVGGSLYGLELVAMYVGGTKLSISPMVFKTSGVIIDSGTVISRLPPTAYSALRNAFRAHMTAYPLTKPLAILDTCYDLSNFQKIIVPKIGVLWGGNLYVDVPIYGIFYANGTSQVCLAFAANRNDSDIGIWGNTQQKTQAVVYNLRAKKIGFGPGGCA